MMRVGQRVRTTKGRTGLTVRKVRPPYVWCSSADMRGLMRFEEADLQEDTEVRERIRQRHVLRLTRKSQDEVLREKWRKLTWGQVVVVSDQDLDAMPELLNEDDTARFYRELRTWPNPRQVGTLDRYLASLGWSCEPWREEVRRRHVEAAAASVRVFYWNQYRGTAHEKMRLCTVVEEHGEGQVTVRWMDTGEQTRIDGALLMVCQHAGT